MKRRAPEVGPKSSRRLPLVVLLSALLVSVLAAWSAIEFCRRLPRVATLPRFLPVEQRREALRQSLRGAPLEVREAFTLQLASDALGGARTGQVEPERLQSAVADSVAALSRSRVGRLHQAAARMWLLEQAREPIESWWPALRVYFEGMQRANLAHYQQALTQHWARVYESLGLGPGTAYGLAVGAVGQPHGPFLQFFVGHSRRVIDEREQAGDAAAAAICRKVLYRLLKQWVLEEGPAGLRLLAADLLADSLETDSRMAAATETQAVARDLRAWRAAYREAARRRPPAVLEPYATPVLAPAAHERLLTWVALTTWLASAALAAGVFAVLLTPWWLRRRDRRRSGFMVRAIISVLLVTGAGLAWIHWWPDAVREDLRGDFSSLRYWWRHPFLAAGLTLALVLAAGLLQRPAAGGQSGFLARAGVIGAGTWLLLAVLLWGSAIAGEFARRDYERATRAVQANAIAAMAGPQADTLLDRLRQWEP